MVRKALSVLVLACALSLAHGGELLNTFTKGSTSRSVTVEIIDSADGTPETGVVFNTAGIDLEYCREATACVDITEVTQTVGGAWTSGGFVHKGHGSYRLDVPDAAFVTGVNEVTIQGTVTGMIVLGGTVKLINTNLEDAVRFGLTALPNANAEAAGGLFTRGSGAGQVNQNANGQLDARAVASGANAINAAGLDPDVSTEINTAVLTAIAGLNNLSAANVRDLVIEDQGGGVSLGCAIAVVLAYAAGDLVTSAGSSTYEEASGTETRVTGSVSSPGNRLGAITCPTY